MVIDLGFRVQGQGLGFNVQGLFRYGSRFRVLGFRVDGLCL